jgi:hypothetical protein
MLIVEKHEVWRKPFFEANQLAAAGFYFTNRSDVIHCAFCGVEVGHWEKGNGSLKEHQSWSTF